MARKAKSKKKSSGTRPSAAGKERKYTRDNNGRFASTGATARGVRLATATGKRRTSRALAGHAKTIEAPKLKSTLSKPRNLKPGNIKPTPKPAAVAKPTPTSKLRKRLNPASIQPKDRPGFVGTISKNKNIRNADNRENAFNRRFARAYARRRQDGTEQKRARSERTRGKALDIYTGRQRLDGTESTVGRFPRVRSSTGYKPLALSIKSPRRFADSRIGVVPPTIKLVPRPEKGNPLAKRAPVGSFRPGQLMSANAFPTNAIAKKPKINDGYKDVTDKMSPAIRRQTIARNVQISLDTAKKQTPWMPQTIKGDKRSATVAFVALNLQTGGRRLQVNSSHPRWATPIKEGIEGRRTGMFASAKPGHIINHEIGHAKHRTMGRQQRFELGDTAIARRVSQYGATSVNEFVAEVRGARKVGSRFDAQIMNRYRKYSGLSAKPAPRFRPTAKAKAAAIAKPIAAPAKPKSLQSKDAQIDRLDVAGRKKQAKALLEMPKPVRKAIRVSQLARRAGFLGSGVSQMDGRGKASSPSGIANIDMGRLRLMGDSGRRKDNFTPGERQAIGAAMVKSGRSLQARLRTTEIGARIKGKNGNTYRNRDKNNKRSTVKKPKGLKPQNPATYGIAKTKTAKKEANDRLTKRYSQTPDQATVNIPGRFSGQAGKSFDASITRAVAAVAAANKTQFKTPAQVRLETAARKAAAAAKPKRAPRTPTSLRTSRAKQVTKRRGMNIGPTAWRPDAAARMADNAARTQSRALAFYKGKK